MIPLRSLARILFALLLTSGLLRGAEMDALVGKWSADREMNGQKVRFVLQLRADSFEFELQDASGEPRYHAKGKAAVAKVGSIRTLSLTDIEGGQDKADLQPVDDDRTLVYITGYNTLTVASNFDRERDNDIPAVTVYRKVTR